MGLMERANTANKWADVLVQELSENLRQRWAAEFAQDLSEELFEQLDEDFQEDMHPNSARRLAENLAAQLRDSLFDELQGNLPIDVRRVVHAELEEMIFQQLTTGKSQEDIRQMALQREEELAETWARWVAGDLTSTLLKRLAERIE